MKGTLHSGRVYSVLTVLALLLLLLAACTLSSALNSIFKKIAAMTEEMIGEFNPPILPEG